MDDPADRAAADLPLRGPASSPMFPRTRGRLAGKVALITCGDTGIGRAAAVRFAREGADIAFTHLSGPGDAGELTRAVEREGAACLTLCGDAADPDFCEALVGRVVGRYGGLDVLVHNLGVRRSPPSFFSLYYLTRCLLPYLRDRPGASIINTASPVEGGPVTDPDAIASAIGAFTRSLAHNLARARIRVNAVGPERGGGLHARVDDLVFLASDDAGTMNGELLDTRAMGR